MSKIKARTLSGFRDILPEESILKQEMIAKLTDVFKSFGFPSIETPHLEYSEVLMPAEGDEVAKQVFRFEDNGGRDVMLRYDLTVPFARFVVQHKHELIFPFKRYAIGSSFRGERPQLGRYREFTQCDIDIVGTRSVAADAEIAEVIAASMQALGIDGFLIRLNNRRVMNGLTESLGVTDKSADVLRVIDKLAKIGKEKVAAELQKEVGISEAATSELLDFVASAADSNQQTLSQLESIANKNQTLAQGVDELKQVFEILSALDLPENIFKLDLSVARGLGYYTGTVYETILTDKPEIGSVCGGGRYDDLTQSFSKDELPGVGASVGLDRLMAALETENKRSTPASVLFTLMDQENRGAVHRIAQQFRNAGVAVEVYPEVSKVKKQFQYADRKGFAHVVVLGGDEIAASSVTIKDLASGEQHTHGSIDDAVVAIKKAVI